MYIITIYDIENQNVRIPEYGLHYYMHEAIQHLYEIIDKFKNDTEHVFVAELEDSEYHRVVIYDRCFSYLQLHSKKYPKFILNIHPYTDDTMIVESEIIPEINNDI